MLLHNGGFCIVKGLLYRVPECLSNHLNWVPRLHPPQSSACGSTYRTQVGGDKLACGGGGAGGGPNSDDWTLRVDRHSGTLLYILIPLRAALKNGVLTTQKMCLRMALFHTAL
jgi:hypothetical protein